MTTEKREALHEQLAKLMTPAEEKAAEEELGADDSPLADAAANPKDPNEVPSWARVPAGLQIPPHRQVVYVRLLAKWTQRPDKGDRDCIMWSLNVADEKMARAATGSYKSEALNELVKRSIRVVDGVKANWTGTHADEGNVNRWWDEIGPKCRPHLINLYIQLHSLDEAQTARFFLDCVAFRHAVPVI